MKGGLDRRGPRFRLTWALTYREVLYQKERHRKGWQRGSSGRAHVFPSKRKIIVANKF
jgi:hypothetical protein